MPDNNGWSNLGLVCVFSEAFQWWQFQYCNAHWSCLVSPGVSAVVYHMALPSSSWGHASLKIDERSILSRLITLLWKLFSFAVNPPWALLIITDFNSRCSPSWFLNEKGATQNDHCFLILRFYVRLDILINQLTLNTGVSFCSEVIYSIPSSNRITPP